MQPRLLVSVVLTALCLAACNYDAPLTAKPTRKIDERLLGNWLGGEEGKDPMHVRKLDDTTYVVAFDKDIYRAFHSDFEKTAFLTVQDLNSSDRLYLYMTWEISADGTQLTLRTVNDKIVTDKTKGQAALQKAVKENLKNPALLGETMIFTRKK
jgi:hypothetical protein